MFTMNYLELLEFTRNVLRLYYDFMRNLRRPRLGSQEDSGRGAGDGGGSLVRFDVEAGPPSADRDALCIRNQ